MHYDWLILEFHNWLDASMDCMHQRGLSVKVRIFQRLFVCSSFLVFSVQGHPQQPLQVLQHHVRASVSSGQAALVGPLSPMQRMNLSIVLPLRNQSQLTSLLSRLYDPSSPGYRQFLSVDQFTAQFAPTAEDYQAVVDFAQANGLTVTGTPANRMVVPISGSVAQIEHAFNLSMKVYRHPTENRTFYSPDREPSVNLTVPLAHIAGLDNFSIPRPLVTRASGTQSATGAAVMGSGPGSSYLASDIHAAYYGGTALTGSGQTVGLVEYDGYNISDVTSTFDGRAISSANGNNYILSYAPAAGTTYIVPINNVLLDGATGAPASGEDTEEVLDIVQAIGMAPGLSQVRVYIGNSDVDILNAMASENIAQQLSISWSWAPADPSTDEFIFEEFAAQGQSAFAASGDSGAFQAVEDFFYPAEDAWVTAVGATDLLTYGAGGAWSSETAWLDSGGGISPDGIAIPSWQAGVANGSNEGSTTLRNVPDVAAEGNFDNYVCNMGLCGNTWGGTSFAAPRWAGFMALVNQQSVAAGNRTVGFINPAIYAIGEGTSYNSDLHDITSGNNDCCAQPSYFTAVTGYDLVTGWGSPNGQLLINALAPPATAGFQLTASPANLTINPGGSGTSTITLKDVDGFTGNVNLTISGLPNGVTASFTTNPTSGSTVLTLNVSSSAIRGPYLLTITGTSGSLTATTTLALEVNAPGFSIAPNSGSIMLFLGTSITDSIAVTDYAGFTGSVNLAITSALPSGVSAYWFANPTTTSSTLTLTASNSATPIRTFVTITGTSGSLSATTTIAMVIQPYNSFDINISPIPFSLVQGTVITSPITVVPAGAFAGSVTLSAPVLPTEVTATFSPNPATTNSVMTLTTSSSAPVGTSNLDVQGTSGSYTSGFEFNPTITVTPQSTYTVGVTSSSVILTQGGTATDTITVTPQNGFTGNVTLRTSQPPSGVTASFVPNSTTGGTSVLTLTASSTAAAGGPIPLEVVGTSLGHSIPVDLFLTVASTPGFTLGPSPASLTLAQGASITDNIVVTPQTGFTGSVNLAITSALPSGLTASFGTNPTTGSSLLTLTANGAVAPGNYLVIIAGTSGIETVTTTIALAVTVPTTTVLAIAPSGGSLTAAESYTLTATVSPTSGTTAPTGSVIFTIGSATQTVALNASGVATYSGVAPPAAGSLTLTAAYLGSTGFAPSSSNTLTETITTIPTDTALSITPSGGLLNEDSSYTLTATVAPTSGATIPTGNVIFTIGTATQTVTLNASGVANFSGVAPAAAGSLTLSAAYQGTTEFAISSSNTLSETIIPPTFSIGGTAVTVVPGATTGNTSTITVTPAGGFTGSVTLTAAITSSPIRAQDPPTLSFSSTSPVSITDTNSGTATLIVSTTAATSSALTYPVLRGAPWSMAGGATLSCLLLFGIPARRRGWWIRPGVLLLFAVLAGGITACGGSKDDGGGNPGTTAGSYTVTVTGTSSSTTATGTVALTVQ
jgi:subtilase family serine protease